MPIWSPGLVEPEDVVRAAARLLEPQFVLEYGQAPWLAISVPAGEEGMAAALHAADGKGRNTSRPPPPQRLDFHTQAQGPEAFRATYVQKTDAQKEPRLAELAKRLGSRCYFSLIRKRLGDGGLLGDRVSVGRAMNKDIVLRHSSISKFHAYLESTQAGWSVTDAGSKNGTIVESVRLANRESRVLTNGERVTFGSVETLFLDTRTVWLLLRSM